jgi:hypothetical protein
METSTEIPQSSPESKSGVRTRVSSVWFVLIALAALFAAAGWAYWNYIYLPTTPQYTLDRFFAAARDKDYDKVYDLVQVPPAIKVLVRNGQELKAMAGRMPGLVPELQEYGIGNVEVSGENATLDATTTMTGPDQRPTSSALKVKMVRTNGIWRVDGNWILSELKKKGMGGVFLNGVE